MTALGQLQELTRAGDWRTTLVPFVLGCVYLWLWWFAIAPGADAALLVLLSLVTTVGFASFGYVLNEWCDIADDTRAGKPNRMAFVRPWQRVAILFSTLLFTLIPWAWLPSNALSWMLIAAQLGSFLVYSIPFPRLKRIPPIAVVLDAAYAYVLPLWLSFHTYALFADAGYASWTLPLFGAVAAIGLRGIILHQVDDVLNDARSGITTLPRMLGTSSTARAILTLLVAEVLLFVIFLSMLALQSFQSVALVLPLLYFLHVGWGLFRGRKALSLRYLPIIPQRHLTDQFYQKTFPLAVLVLLAFQSPLWAVIIPLHLLLVVSGAQLAQWRFLLQKMAVFIYYRLFRKVANAAVNYPIFLLFLLFGVDLRKEDTSALSYLRRRFGS